MRLLTNEIYEIGNDGLKAIRKELKFGDIVENGWASVNNPTRFGIVVRVNRKDIDLTDGEGKFWKLCFDKESKITIRGSILLIDWETDYELLKKYYISI
jgi:hypothetical protein